MKNALQSITEIAVDTVMPFIGESIPLTTFVYLRNKKIIPLIYPETSMSAYTDIIRAIINVTDAAAYVVVSNGIIQDEDHDDIEAVCILGVSIDGEITITAIDKLSGQIINLGKPDIDGGGMSDLFNLNGIDVEDVMGHFSADFMSTMREATESGKNLQ